MLLRLRGTSWEKLCSSCKETSDYYYERIQYRWVLVYATDDTSLETSEGPHIKHYYRSHESYLFNACAFALGPWILWESDNRGSAPHRGQSP
jgi:hypothetical protein